MVTVAITGASSGLGLETARALVTCPEVTKLVLTVRSQHKADATIKDLAASTGKDKSFFQAILMDMFELDTIKAAIEEFPPVDRLCLNAGGLGQVTMHKESGATDAMVSNVIGHSILVDGLLAAKKIPDGARVVYVGSEVSRTILSFTGLLPMYYCYFGEGDMKKAISSNYFTLLPLRRQLGDYKNCKIVGQLYFAQMAVEHPKIHWTSTSPGGVMDPKVNFVSYGKFPLSLFGAAIPGFFALMNITHSLEEGVERYVDMLTGEPKFESGAMAFSDYNCGCVPWGANTKHMVDNRSWASYLSDKDLYAKTCAEVRRVGANWQAGAGAGAPPATQNMA